MPPGEGIMDEAEVKRIVDYVEGLENGFGDWDCREPATRRQLMKLHLIIERLARTICETRDERLRSVLAVLEDRARRCKQCMEARLAVHT
jgi:hypothetical protein